MEPFDRDELRDTDLDAMLQQWRVPQVPASLRQAVFGEPRSWWARVWTASVRVPLLAACALVLAMAAALWFWPRRVPPPVTVEKMVRVEVPVVQERVVTKTVYRDREAPHKQVPPPIAWRPVAELQPRVVRSEEQEPK